MAGLNPGILVTRTLPGARASAARLTDLGYTAFIDPVLEVHCTGQGTPDLDGIQAVIVTSAHGVTAFVNLQNTRVLPLYCFAGASLEAANHAVYPGPLHTLTGNADELTAMVSDNLRPQNGAVLWVRGCHFAYDVTTALVTKGFAVREWEAYVTRPVKTFLPETIKAWHDDNITAALFHSARGAKTFLTLAGQADLSLGQISAFAISKEVAKSLVCAGFNAVHNAQTPSDTAIIETVLTHLPLK